VVKKVLSFPMRGQFWPSREGEILSFDCFLERKHMSTKTTIKRIALVAAVAAAFGGLSTVAANAANGSTYTTTLGTITPTVPVVGTAVTVPLKIASDVASVATAQTETWTATFVHVPVNSKLVSASSLVADVSNQDASLATAGAALTQTTASANTVVATAGASAAVLTTPVAAGEYTFTPDVPGVYELTIAGTGTAVGSTDTAVTNFVITVGGSQVTQAVSGIGTNTATAVTGGTATVVYTAPEGSASGAIYNVTATGGSVLNPLGAANNSTRLTSAAASGVVSFAGDTAVGATAKINGTDYTGGFSYTSQANATTANGTLIAAAKSDSFSFVASSSVAGTETITIASINAATGAPSTKATITITWTATATTPVASLSTAFLNTGATYAASNTTTPYASKSLAAATVAANIGVTLNDTNGLALNGQKLTVTLAGPGSFSVAQNQSNSTGTNTGLRASTDTNANSGNLWQIDLFADGTAGTTTITIADGSYVVATKTFYFTGSAATIAVTQNFSIAKASSTGAELGVATSNTSATTGYVPAISAEVTDANGNVIAQAPSCLISDLTVLSSCVIVADNNATYGAGTGYYNVDVVSAPGGVSGKSATVTLRILNSDGVTYTTSTPLTFTLGGAIVKTAATLDSTSYTPGQPMKLSITATDASGNPTYDNQSIAYAISSSAPVGGSLPAVTKVFAKGVYATSLTAPSLYAPSVSGPFTISVTGNDVANTVTSVSATVTGGEASANAAAATDAANEATDAANAATDAANAAADAADAATSAAQDAGAKADAALAAVTALSAKITVLAAQIAKIVKKLGA